jgi:hypothetical protein
VSFVIEAAEKGNKLSDVFEVFFADCITHTKLLFEELASILFCCSYCDLSFYQLALFFIVSLCLFHPDSSFLDVRL